MPDEASSSHALLTSMRMPDEHVLHTGEVSAGIYWKTLALLGVAALFMTLAISYELNSRLLVLFAGAFTIKIAIMAALACLTRHYLLIAVTDKRVIIRKGIINLEVIQLRYAQIESSEVGSTIPGRFLGYSSVFIRGTGGQTLAVPFIVNAGEISKSVTEILARRDDAEQH